MKQLYKCGCRNEGCGVQCLGEVILDNYFDYILFEIECDICGEFYIEIEKTLMPE